MCKPTKALGSGLGTIFTGGLSQTNVGNGLFKKIGNKTGDVLTLGTGNIGIGGDDSTYGTGPGISLSPSLQRPPANGGPNLTSNDELSRLGAIFGPVQQYQNDAIDTQTGEEFKKLRSGQAARGVLRSGIADYPGIELQKANVAAKANVASGLANILGNTEAQRSLFNTQSAFLKQQSIDEFNRNLQLANMISGANKPSTLSQIFGGVSAFGPTLASLFGSGGGLASIFGSGAGAAGAAELAPELAMLI